MVIMSGYKNTTSQQRENCGRLADYLEKVLPTGKFKMRDWVKIDHDEGGNFCGTTCCAMGWAAMSGQFKDQGLGYGVQGQLPEQVGSNAVSNAQSAHEEQLFFEQGFLPFPTINGIPSDWSRAGVKVFGEDAMYSVFAQGYLTGHNAIQRLRHIASGEDIFVPRLF